MDPRMQGLTQGGAGTATEAAIIQQQTLKRLTAKLWLLHHTFLTEIGRLRMANILQFYSQPKMEKIIGEAGMADFDRRVSEAKEKGIYKEINKQPYQAKYPKLRLKNKTIDVSPDGEITEMQTKGDSFFEIKPELLLPQNGSYDIVFSASPNITISKALEQQSFGVTLQNPLVVAAVEQGIYDLAHITDEYLRLNDKDPEEFKAPAVTGQQIDPQQIIDLANEENQRLMQGEKIGPTPYATQDHTNIHMQFMKQPDFMKLPMNSTINDNFLLHVSGEIMAIQKRGANPFPTQPGNPAGGATTPPPTGQTQPPGQQANPQLQAMSPNKVQGGGQVTGMGLPNPTAGGGAPISIMDKFRKAIGR